MSDLVTTRRQAQVLIVIIDNPPVNALSPGVAEAIAAAIRAAQTDDAVTGIVVVGAGSTFVAGADIKEFPALRDSGATEGGPARGLQAVGKFRKTALREQFA